MLIATVLLGDDGNNTVHQNPDSLLFCTFGLTQIIMVTGTDDVIRAIK